MAGLPRPGALEALRRALSRSPVVALLGARQVGKSTLARDLASTQEGEVHHLDLEDSRDRRAIDEEWLTVEPLRGLVILDEVQRKPDIFPMLRVLADRPDAPARFLVLGSASPALLRQTSESLAGRIAYLHLDGFGLEEVGPGEADRLWLRGGFPLSFLAPDDAASAEWRRDFLRTFLERDAPELGVRIPSATLDRFWRMLAHWNGQVFQAAEFARNFGVANHTVVRYVDALVDTFMVLRLPPWHEKLAKRQVKSPKVYMGDTGLLHTLLDVEDRRALDACPHVGASWEGFCIAAVIRRLGARPDQCYFWATHASAELDLLVVAGNRRLGFEIKRTATPSVTPSMRIAREDLRLDSLDVLHAGPRTFSMKEGFRAVALGRILEDIQPLRTAR